MAISLADDLRRIAKGEILSDSWSRDIYSVDASHYTVKPSMIACPLNESDVKIILVYIVEQVLENVRKASSVSSACSLALFDPKFILSQYLVTS
jgi:hypothetical protein